MKKILLLFISGVLLLSGCGSEAVVEIFVESDIILPRSTEGTEDIFKQAAETEALRLFVNEKTAEVAVENRQSGKIWYSNPQNYQEDPLANEENKSLMASQLVIHFSAQDLPQKYDSYTWSVKRGQFEISKIDGGVAVAYTVGEAENRLLVPYIIPKEKYETHIIESLTDESDKALMNRRYRFLELAEMEDQEEKNRLQALYPKVGKEPVYVLRQNPPTPSMEREIDRVLQKTSYGFEELDDDHTLFGITAGKKPTLFGVTLEYRLKDDALSVSVPAKKIKMSNNTLIESIDLLPFFGAAGTEETGYALLPDGSGSLMDFNNGKSALEPYVCRVYGKDLSLNQDEQIGDEIPCPFPVFGMKTGENGMLCVIEEGDAAAEICARPAGSLYSYNHAYSKFILREKQTIKLKQDNNIHYMMQPDRYQGTYRQNYYFLKGQEANYVGMAKLYKKLLFKNAKADAQPVFQLELLGAYEKSTSLFGIPFKSTQALTGFDEAEKITKAVSDAGAENINVVYTGWFNGGLHQKFASSVKAESVLGGKKGFSKLAESLAARGIVFSPSAEFLYTYADGVFGFSPGSDAARTIKRTVAKIYPFSEATFLQDFTRTPFYIVRPTSLSKEISLFLTSYNNYDIKSLNIGSLGRNVNSDFRETGGADRESAKNVIRSEIEKLSDSFSLVISTGNAYAACKAKYVLNLPMTFAGFDITDESVPFAQIVLSGFVCYSGAPLNLDGGGRSGFLKAVETGASLYYTLSGESSSKLKDTEFNRYYSTYYSDRLDDIKESVSEHNAVLGKADGTEIINHERLAYGVYRTTFKNDRRVTVNYTDDTYNYEGRQIGPESYYAETGGDIG